MSLASPPISKADIFHEKVEELSISDTVVEALEIIESILNYTESLDIKENQISVFDGEMPQTNKIKKSNSNNSLSSEVSTDSDNNQFILYDFEIFIKKWIKYFEFDENMMILSLMNLDKLLTKKFWLTKKNYFKVIYTCMMITHKYYDDHTYNNKDYAEILGESVHDILDMEMEYLKIVDFNLFINEDEFKKYKRKLINLFNKCF